MRKSIFILSVIVLCACARIEQTELNLVVLQSAPEALTCAAMFSVDNGVYIFGGRKADDTYSNSLYKYDIASDSWTCLGSTPLQARVYPVAATLDDKVYIGLGYNGKGIYQSTSYLQDFWRYDTQTNSWTQLADYPDNKTDNATIFTLNGYIYVGLGFNGFTEQFYRYNPTTDSWQNLRNPFPLRCTGASAATTTDRAFIGCGFHHGSHNEWYEYIPEKETYKKRKSIPSKGRYNAACAADNEAVYLFGGWHYGDTLTNGLYFDDILRYDIEQNKWTKAKPMPCGKAMNLSATTLDNIIYFGLGESPTEQPKSSFYKLLPLNNN